MKWASDIIIYVLFICMIFFRLLKRVFGVHAMNSVECVASALLLYEPNKVNKRATLLKSGNNLAECTEKDAQWTSIKVKHFEMC